MVCNINGSIKGDFKLTREPHYDGKKVNDFVQIIFPGNNGEEIFGTINYRYYFEDGELKLSFIEDRVYDRRHIIYTYQRL